MLVGEEAVAPAGRTDVSGMSLAMGDAGRRLPRKLRPVVMGPASRFACAGRRARIFKQPRQLANCSVIASAAKQSILPQLTKLDCFAALAMTGVARARKHSTSSFLDVQSTSRMRPGSMLRIAPE